MELVLEEVESWDGEESNAGGAERVLSKLIPEQR